MTLQRLYLGRYQSISDHEMLAPVEVAYLIGLEKSGPKKL